MQTEKEDQYLQQHPELGNLQEEFEQADGETPLPESYSEDMLKAIVAQTQPGAQPGDLERAQPRADAGRVRAIRWSLSAAAAILILAGVGLLLKEKRTNRGRIVAKVNRPVRWLVRTNATNRQDTWTDRKSVV